MDLICSISGSTDMLLPICRWPVPIQIHNNASTLAYRLEYVRTYLYGRQGLFQEYFCSIHTAYGDHILNPLPYNALYAVVMVVVKKTDIINTAYFWLSHTFSVVKSAYSGTIRELVLAVKCSLYPKTPILLCG